MSESASAASAAESSTFRRALTWGSGILGVLAVLVLVAALVLPRLFTSEQLKGYVIPPLEEATGRQVEIDAIGLRVLPAPAIRVSGFRLANAEGYGPAPAVEARALNVNVGLWPLLFAKIRPTAVGLERPVVRYVVADDGATNFDDLGDPADTTDEEGPLLGDIPLSNVRVTEAQVHYTDQGAEQAIRLDFDAKLGILPDGPALTSDGAVTLQTVRALLPSMSPDTLMVRDAQVDYDVRVAPSAGTVDLRTLRLETAPLTLLLEGALTGLSEQPTADLAFETGATDLAEIAAFVPAAAIEGLNPRGTLDLEGTVKGPLSGEADAASELAVNASGRLAEAGVDYQGTALLRDLSGDLSGSLDGVALRSMEGQLLGASLAGHAAVQQLRTEPQIDLDLQTGSMNLADLVAFVPPEQVGDYNPQGRLRLDATATGLLPTDAASLQKLIVNGTGQLSGFGVDYGGREMLRNVGADLAFSSDALAARSLKGELLGASLAGSAAVRQFRTEPQIDLDLQTGPMNLADLVAFVPPEQVGSYNPQGTLRLDATATGPMPTDAASLQNLVVNGTGQLASFGMDYEGQALLRSLSTNLSFSGSTAKAEGIDGQLLGKPISGAVTVRELRDTPQVEGQLAGGADMGQLMALQSEDSSTSVQATAEYDISFVGPLQSPEDIRPDGLVQLTDVRVPYESFRQPIEIPGATLKLTGTGLSMDRSLVRSGDQTAMLQATMRNLFPISKGLADTNPTLAATIQLTSDRLDLEALYPAGDAGDIGYSDLFAAQLAGSRVEGQSPEALATELYGGVELPDYAVDGRVEIGTLLNDPQRYDDLAFDFQMENRRLTIRNLQGSTYGGALSGTFTLDQRPATSSARTPPSTVRFASTRATDRDERSTGRAVQSDVTYNFQLREADAGAVLNDWTSMGRLVTGTLTFSADGKSPLTPGLLPQTNLLSAVGESVVVNGGLGLDLGPASVLVEALGLPASPFKNIQRLGGPFVIQDGRLQVKAWPLETEQFDGTVEGALGLGGSLDLKVTLDLPLELIEQSKIGARLGGEKGQMGEVLKKLLGSPVDDETIPVTVRIGGTMQDPDLQVLNQDAIESRLESLAKGAGLNLLRDLFGRGGGEKN